MDKEVKKEEKKEQPKEELAPRIVGGYVGKYSIGYSNKLYSFEFPIENTLELNLTVVTYLRDEIIKAIAEASKKEKEKKEEPKIQK